MRLNSDRFLHNMAWPIGWINAGSIQHFLGSSSSGKGLSQSLFYSISPGIRTIKAASNTSALSRSILTITNVSRTFIYIMTELFASWPAWDHLSTILRVTCGNVQNHLCGQSTKTCQKNNIKTRLTMLSIPHHQTNLLSTILPLVACVSFDSCLLTLTVS